MTLLSQPLRRFWYRVGDYNGTEDGGLDPLIFNHTYETMIKKCTIIGLILLSVMSCGQSGYKCFDFTCVQACVDKEMFIRYDIIDGMVISIDEDTMFVSQIMSDTAYIGPKYNSAVGKYVKYEKNGYCESGQSLLVTKESVLGE